MRAVFAYFNRFMVLMWRLGMGGAVNGWPEVAGRIMVVTTRGRRSGRPRRTPLNYTIIDGEIYCTAGFGSVSDWYRNILRDPQVEVWLPDGWWAGVAEECSESPARIGLLREVLIASGAAAPLAGVDPYRLPDEALAEATASYRLIRIRRTEARSGPGGPSDLVWAWPLGGIALIGAIALGVRRRSR